MTREVFCFSCYTWTDVQFPFGYKHEDENNCPECGSGDIKMEFVNT